jgi:transcription elongation factor Elf1
MSKVIAEAVTGFNCPFCGREKLEQTVETKFYRCTKCGQRFKVLDRSEYTVLVQKITVTMGPPESIAIRTPEEVAVAV